LYFIFKATVASTDMDKIFFSKIRFSDCTGSNNENPGLTCSAGMITEEVTNFENGL